MRGLGKLHLLFEELHNIDMDLTGMCVCVRLDGMEKGIFSMVNIQYYTVAQAPQGMK